MFHIRSFSSPFKSSTFTFSPFASVISVPSATQPPPPPELDELDELDELEPFLFPPVSKLPTAITAPTIPPTIAPGIAPTPDVIAPAPAPTPAPYNNWYPPRITIILFLLY